MKSAFRYLRPSQRNLSRMSPDDPIVMPSSLASRSYHRSDFASSSSSSSALNFDSKLATHDSSTTPKMVARPSDRSVTDLRYRHIYTRPDPKSEESEAGNRQNMLQQIQGGSLEQQILSLTHVLQPTPEKLRQQDRFLRDLFYWINKNYRRGRYVPPTPYTLSPFGSTGLGIATPDSDVDVCIVDPTFPDGSRDMANPDALPFIYNVNNLKRTLDELRGPLRIKDILSVKAKVAILKIETLDGIKVDLNINEQLGLRNTQLLFTYIHLNPSLMIPLCKTVKFWAKQRSLNDPTGRGGIVTFSSYSLLLMLIAFLQGRGAMPNLQSAEALDGIPKVYWTQCCNTRSLRFGSKADLTKIPPPVRYDTTFAKNWNGPLQTMTAPDGLRDFFRFYASFDWAQQGISIKADGIVSRTLDWSLGDGLTAFSPHHFVCIRDPFEINRNTCSGIQRSGLDLIQNEFKRAHEMIQHGAGLAEICACEEREARPTKPKHERLTQPIFGRNHFDGDRRRRRPRGDRTQSDVVHHQDEASLDKLSLAC